LTALAAAAALARLTTLTALATLAALPALAIVASCGRILRGGRLLGRRLFCTPLGFFMVFHSIMIWRLRM
jgi:hypothetical protein